jgi:hypothetical protein
LEPQTSHDFLLLEVVPVKAGLLCEARDFFSACFLPHSMGAGDMFVTPALKEITQCIQARTEQVTVAVTL